ncbi:MAG: CIA30 family protein [Acidobacteria bacterium]|nr:CIA30 family protein [Acidobacteriota bacterium]
MHRIVMAVSSCLLALATASLLGQATESLAVVNAIVVDGTGAAPYRGSVLMSAGRITAADPHVEIPADAQTIDARGKTLLPGLFDLHTHVRFSAAGGVYGDWGKNLKAYLYCGVTSVADYGVTPELIPTMRKLIADGALPAPRIAYAIRFSTPAGHGTESGRLDSIEVRTPLEGRAAMKQALAYEPDAIKVFTDGWRYDRSPEMSSMNLETLTAIVDEAHKVGVEVTTHTVTVARHKIAARAGVDAVVHGIGDGAADDELIELFKTKRTVYAPTLVVYHPAGTKLLTPLLEAVLDPAVQRAIDPPLTAPSVERPALTEPYERGNDGQPTPNARRWDHLLTNNKHLHDAGVTFGVGSDAGVGGTYHGWATLREIELLVLGGLTPLQAIQAATLHGAEALNVEAERGSIEAGKLADLVLVDGRPHEDIRDIEKVERVWLAGREIDRAQLKEDIARPGPTPLPAVKTGPLLDDMEQKDGRTTIGTLWAVGTESRNDHSQILMTRTLRGKRNHALLITAKMAQRKEPYVTANLPLTRGGLQAADLSGYRGLRFDARGEDEYVLQVQTRGVRDFDYHRTSFRAGDKWKSVKVPFASLRQERGKQPMPWSGEDVHTITFRLERPSGESGWLELDNVKLY